MNVYDTVNRLAEEIKNSDEYNNFKNVKKELEQKQELKLKITEFETKRQELQMITIRGGQMPEEKTKEVENMYAELIKDETALKYFDTELKFSVLIADVNKIIGDAIKDVLK